MNKTPSLEQANPLLEAQRPNSPVAQQVMSPVLARLIAEVRHESPKGSGKYDRVHNRHNR